MEDLWTHPKHASYYRRLEELEKNRKYCKHDEQHFTEVYNVMKAINVQNACGYTDEILFACAYFHDIGRVVEYEEQISHNEASSVICREILLSLGWKEAEIAEICEAILSHRNRKPVDEWLRLQADIKSLADLLSYADQMSRCCFACDVRASCHWKEEEKLNYEDWNKRIST